MDIVFNCPTCKQQLEADAGAAGSEIACPSCNAPIVIPEVNPANVRGNPIAASAAAKEEYHFAVPIRDAPSESLIHKPNPPLEAAGRTSERQLRIKSIRRTDCVEVGHDRFDEIVSDVLNKIGETNIVAIHPLSYTHLDLGTRQMLTDFGVMIIYKG